MSFKGTETEKTKRHEILMELGFKRLNNGKYEHWLLQNEGIEFDFSAASVPGIIYIAYKQGKKKGVEELRSEIKNLLYL